MNAGPLADVRIADLTIVTAGASATQILADLGADVIKVESGQYVDPFRLWDSGLEQQQDVERPWDQSPPFNCVNRNKRSVALDLKHPQGREALLRLVQHSDVVAENFRLGVMERLGLGFETLRTVRPDLVMISLSSQGESGPKSAYRSFGSTLDALSGLMSITGYGVDAPVWSSNEVNYPDQVVSTFGAALIMVGLRRRRRTGHGVHIDLSQRELVTSMIGEVALDFAVNHRVQQPRGNRDASMAPHGCYRCRGADAWVAITVKNDDQWSAMARAMDQPGLADDPRFATFQGRWQHLDELDVLINQWTSTLDKHAVMQVLQAVGVPAGAVLAGPELWEDANLKRREFYREVRHPLAGAQRQRGWPFHLSRGGASIRRPAPCLGEHTQEVLSGLLGYSAAEIRELKSAGVLVDEPVGGHR